MLEGTRICIRLGRLIYVRVPVFAPDCFPFLALVVFRRIRERARNLEESSLSDSSRRCNLKASTPLSSDILSLSMIIDSLEST